MKKIRDRLAIEEKLLQGHFGSSFKIQDPDGSQPGVLGKLRTSRGHEYVVWIPLREGRDRFPDAAPPAYIVHPKLETRSGRRLPEYSHPMHVVGRSPQGHPRICYMDECHWETSFTLYKVALKLLLWCEAFDAYIESGKSMSKLLTPA